VQIKPTLASAIAIEDMDAVKTASARTILIVPPLLK
jgi:hypothetical protein